MSYTISDIRAWDTSTSLNAYCLKDKEQNVLNEAGERIYFLSLKIFQPGKVHPLIIPNLICHSQLTPTLTSMKSAAISNDKPMHINVISRIAAIPDTDEKAATQRIMETALNAFSKRS